jgi:hypothetical protein
MSEQQNTSSTIALVVAWLWAGIPLLIGVYQTVEKASALFK